ncbi:MAG TPA: urease accessory protein UreD [Desulfobulbus sp.]|nr:urease accessory protein UreD [Desulfobulbus sp.]
MTAPVQSRQTAGWQARLRLVFAPGRDRTLLVRNRHRGPLVVQRPLYPEARVCHACILHPPGGVVGGDRLHTGVQVEEQAAALLTTPGATKFYRSAGATAVQEQRLQVREQGCLEWLPQETILFPGARAVLATEIELAGNASFVGWEILCLGLPVNHARFDSGALTATLRVSRNGRPLLQERLRIRAGRDLDRPAGLRGLPVCATLVATGAAPHHLESLRPLLAGQGRAMAGATLADDLLVARYLGDSTMEARSLFAEIWSLLRPRLLGRPPCPPRIWAT